MRYAAWVPGTPDGDERGLIVGREHRAAHSPPTGTRKNSFDVARASPSVSTAHMPSVRPVAFGLLPSVAIHSRPAESIAQLSGMPNQPFSVVAVEKVAPTSATEGSPHFSSTSHLPWWRRSRHRPR